MNYRYSTSVMSVATSNNTGLLNTIPTNVPALF